MPLQNRVTPFSAIEATEARGLFLGNRGCLHDAERRLVTQRWRTRTWVVCRLDFKGRRRTPMTPGRYTELFFLDEATALAAGHRPCFECRRPEAVEFAALWARLLGEGGRARAPEVDRALHGERVGPDRRQRRRPARCEEAPDGAFVVLPDRPGEAWMVHGEALLRWTHAGYDLRLSRDAAGQVELLTPRSTTAVLAAGYRPVLHGSAWQWAGEAAL